MSTAWRALKAIALVASVGAAPAAAQVCAGNAGFGGTPIRIGGGIDLGEGATTIGGSVTAGKENSLYYGGGLGIVSPDFGDGGIAITAGIGKELERPIGERLRLCPFAGIAHITNAGFGSITDFSVGGTVGYPLTPSASGTTQVVLVAGYTGIYERYELAAGFGSAEEWYGIIDAGVGIILSGNLSLSPGIRIYFRHSGSPDPTIALRASYGLARR